MSKYDRLAPIRRYQQWIAAQDKDPSLWPIEPGSRVFMVDCQNCGVRLNPKALGFHQKRCLGLRSAA